MSTAQPTRRLYTPSGGLVEAILRASPDPTSGVRIGVKAHNDPRLHDDMEEVMLGLDAGASTPRCS